MSSTSSATPGFQAATTDAFFVLRDCRELFQRRLVEIARSAGIVVPPVLEAWRKALGEGHDELASQAQRAGFEQAAGLTASRITLMGDDDLELEIRIGEITKRLADIGGTALWKAHLRYMALLRRPEMAKEENPVGPEAIALGLWAVCRESGGTLDSRKAVLARLEEQMREALPSFYNEINDLLAHHGIGPSQAQPTVTGSGARPGAASASAGAANPLAALHGTLASQGQPGAAAAGGDVSLSAASLAMLNQLLARLSALDLAAPAPTAAGEAAGQPVLGKLKAAELGIAQGGAEAIALDTLARIFEAILARPELPDAVKAALGRLQIPLLKVAILDAGFFAAADHPARRLVNGIGRAALGLPRNAGREHPVCARLDQIASAASEGLEKGQGGLDTVLADLAALIAERDAVAEAAVSPFLPLALEQERSFKATAAAGRWVDSLATQQTLPPEIDAFLNEHWLRVMQAAWLDGGEEGERWRADAATVADLLWSIEPKPDLEERKRLAGLVPSLLRRLNAGLDAIGVAQEAREPFLDACFALQTAALRGPGAAAARPPAALSAGALHDSVGAPWLKAIELAGRRLLCLYLPGDGRSPNAPRPSMPWALGDWVQLTLAGEDSARYGRFSWVSPNSGSVLLTNPDWADAVALTPAAADLLLRAGEAALASSVALFDSAAEQALRQLQRG